MEKLLQDLEKAIAAEKVNTEHLAMCRAFLAQLKERFGKHAEQVKTTAAPAATPAKA